MIDLKYRIDFVRLDGEAMPSSGNIIDGSTCYIIDTGELYIYYNGTWYNSDIDKQNESGQNENQQSENTRDNIIENNAELVKTSKENIIENNDEITNDSEVIVNDK